MKTKIKLRGRKSSIWSMQREIWLRICNSSPPGFHGIGGGYRSISDSVFNILYFRKVCLVVIKLTKGVVNGAEQIICTE